MKAKIVLGSRILMGIIFLVFGANGLMFLLTGSGFIPMPPPAESMQSFMGGLMNGVYLMPLVKIIEVVGGALLLANKYVNLAIVLLAPLVVNILAIHIFLDMGGLPMALALTVFTVILIKDRWSDFGVLLKA